MKAYKALIVILVLALLLAACGTSPAQQQETEAVEIMLSDSAIQVDDVAAATEPGNAVYVANDIIYYESGKDFTYGEGKGKDAHSPEEAAAHTVVHITKPGTYSLSGKLSQGQIAVDLGKDAKDDPEAVVTLILNGVDITCQVAPAVIFYNVFECGQKDEKTATRNVDTTAAGANVIIADGSENTVNGSYVARIYKPDSVVLNDAGTKVDDAKKLHKYDGAFYSKMSMNINGGRFGTGVLHINAENEGLDSELHLTINGGNIAIRSGNDGINTNEDGISVTKINGGRLEIQVTGETGEGDGIDSNGWLVINGGTVIASACANSADAGIDSDMGIYINGGIVMASGHMLDRIEDGGQTYAVFNFAERQSGAQTVRMKNAEGVAIMEWRPKNAYSVLVFSSPELKEGTYTLWNDSVQLAGRTGGFGGGFGGMMPPGGNMQPPDDMQRPEGWGTMEDFTLPEGMEWPQGWNPQNGEKPSDRPERPEGEGQFGDKGGRPNSFRPGGNIGSAGESTTEFKIVSGANTFAGVAPYMEDLSHSSSVPL